MALRRVYLSCVFMSLISVSQPVLSQPAFDAELIDSAVTERLVQWFFTDVVGREYTKYGVLHSGKAMNYMAQVVYHDPGVQTSDGTPVVNRLLEQIRHMIAGGNEPLCRGTIAGWADNSAAQTLALAKYTPAVWDRLTTDEKARCDWLMKALTVAGNYCQNYDAHVRRCLFQTYNWRKSWNPNHQEGYVGVMIAAWFYFGGTDAVNAVLASFDYDQWTAALNGIGFTNITGCWQATGKDRMENGGFDDDSGTIVSVRTPFTYENVWSAHERVEYEPFAVFTVLADRMYSHLCRDTVGGTAYTIDGNTPWAGHYGMGYEFDARDASGLRSDARYVYDGWCNSVLTMATLIALDGFGSGPARDDVAKRMVVGSEDLIYKLSAGYQGRSKGSARYSDSTKVDGLGYYYVRDIWWNLIKEDFKARTTAFDTTWQFHRPDTGTATVNAEYVPRTFDLALSMHSNRCWYPGVRGGGEMTVTFTDPVTLDGILLGIGRTGPYNIVISLEAGGQWHEVVNEYRFSADSVRPNILLFDEVSDVSAIRFTTTDKWLFLSELLGASYETAPAVGTASAPLSPHAARIAPSCVARVYDLSGRVVRRGRVALPMTRGDGFLRLPGMAGDAAGVYPRAPR